MKHKNGAPSGASFFRLGYKFPAVLAVFIRSPINLRDVSFPVAMPRTDGRGPLQRICPPGIRYCHFPTFPDGIKEVQEEQELSGEYDYRDDAKLVHFTDGGPYFDEYRNDEYADEWFAMRDRMLHVQQK